ncbi:MAG: S-layer homology domain-containing protein [Oscillospiraceae bacterium]|nr:S-layer homology domain-containing protein [Oscillospiraceae bacterium]
MKAHHGKRFLSFLLVLCMIAAVAPLTLAADSALGAIQEANAENNFDYEYSTKTLTANGTGGTVTIAFNEPSGGLSSRDYYAAVIPSSSTSADDVRYVCLTETNGVLSSVYWRDGYTSFTVMLVQSAMNGGTVAISTTPASISQVSGNTQTYTLAFETTLDMSTTLAGIVDTYKDTNAMNSLRFTAHLRFPSALVPVESSLALDSEIFEISTSSYNSSENGVDITCTLRDDWQTLSSRQTLSQKLRQTMTFSGSTTIVGSSVDALVDDGTNALNILGWCTVENIPSNDTFTMGDTMYLSAPTAAVALNVADTMQVQVTDDDGNPVSGATVTVTLLGASSGTTATTNSSGVASFEESYGVYKVVVSYADANGEHTKTDTFSFISTSDTIDEIVLNLSETTTTVTTTVNASSSNDTANEDDDDVTVTASASGLESAVDTSSNDAILSTTYESTSSEDTSAASTVEEALIEAAVTEDNDITEDDVEDATVTVTDVSIDLTVATVDTSGTSSIETSTSAEETLTAIEEIKEAAASDSSTTVSDTSNIVVGEDIVGATIEDTTLALTDVLDIEVNMTTTATVTTSSGSSASVSTTTKVSNTNSWLTIYVKISEWLNSLIENNSLRFEDVVAYRYHDNTPEALTKIGQDDEKDGFFTMTAVNNGQTERYIGIRSDKFSIYALGIELEEGAVVPTSTSSNSGGSSSGGSGGSGSSSSNVTVSSSTNGKISVDKTNASSGSTVTITVTPDEGYRLNVLLVTDAQGNSVTVTANGDGTYSFVMPSGKVTISATFAIEIADVSTTGVADMLDTVNHSAYMHGYTDGTFAPDGSATRAEIAQVFYNLLLDQNVEITTSFVDVAEDAWYADAVNTLASLGIVNGVGDGKFSPNANITRAEFVAIAARFADVADSSVSFDDVSADHWACEYISTAAAYGWVTGETESTFAPSRAITRAEIATIVNRMLGRLTDESAIDAGQGTSFPDVSQSHWAWYQIAEATTDHSYTKTDGAETWTA